MKHTDDLQKGWENDFIYTKAGTCITERWKKMGWIPASEDPSIQAKWAMYRALATRTLADSVENI